MLGGMDSHLTPINDLQREALVLIAMGSAYQVRTNTLKALGSRGLVTVDPHSLGYVLTDEGWALIPEDQADRIRSIRAADAARAAAPADHE